jgi:hypothetical protein
MRQMNFSDAGASERAVYGYMQRESHSLRKT